MAIRAKWLVLLPAVAGIAAVACGNGAATAEGSPSWSTAARAVSYQIDESIGTERRAVDLKLDFGDNDVRITELGSTVAATMSPSGRLTYRPGDQSPPVIYELIALSVLPPAGDELRVGHTWSYTRPDDAAAAASQGIVAQERFDYQVTAIDGDKVTVDVRGFLRIAPSAGAKAALASFGLPADTEKLLATYKPYVVGSAEFDRASGETVRASGLRLPFAFLTAGDPLSPGKALSYDLVRQ